MRRRDLCYNAVMAQVTIRNLDEGTLASLKRRAAAEGRSVSAVSRDILSAGARARYADALDSDISEEEAWARMERVWKAWESEAPVKGCSSDIIREGREERWATIDPQLAARERAEQEGKK